MSSLWITALLLAAGVQDSGYVQRHVSEDGSLVLVCESDLRRGRLVFVDLIDEPLRPVGDARLAQGVFDARWLVGGRGEVLGGGSIFRDPRRRGRRGRRGRGRFEDSSFVLVSSKGIWPAIVIQEQRMTLLDITCRPTTWDLEERWIRAGVRPWADPAWATLRNGDKELVIGDEAGRLMVCDLHRQRWDAGDLEDALDAFEHTDLASMRQRLAWLEANGLLDEARQRLAQTEEPSPARAAVAFLLGEPVDRARQGAESVVLSWKRSDRATEHRLDATQLSRWEHGRLAASLLGAAARDGLARALEGEADPGAGIALLRWLTRQLRDLPAQHELTAWPGRARARLGLLSDEVLEELPATDWLMARARHENAGIVQLALEALEARLRLEGTLWSGFARSCEELIEAGAPHRGLIAWKGVQLTGNLDAELLVTALGEELAEETADELEVELLRGSLVVLLGVDYGEDLRHWRAALVGDRDR